MDEAALIRLMRTGFQRYTADPATREQSARAMVSASLSLLASQTSAGEASVHAAHIVATLANEERRERASG